MVFPLIAAAASEAAPLILSVIGSFLPSIVDAMRSSPTEDEARAKVKPVYDQMIDQLVANGMTRDQAQIQAEQAIQPQLAAAHEKEPLNPWLNAGLGLAGGVAGYKAGGALAGKLGKPAILAATSAAPKPGLPAMGVSAPIAPTHPDIPLMPPSGEFVPDLSEGIPASQAKAGGGGVVPPLTNYPLAPQMDRPPATPDMTILPPDDIAPKAMNVPRSITPPDNPAPPMPIQAQQADVSQELSTALAGIPDFAEVAQHPEFIARQLHNMKAGGFTNVADYMKAIGG